MNKYIIIINIIYIVEKNLLTYYLIVDLLYNCQRLINHIINDYFNLYTK